MVIALLLAAQLVGQPCSAELQPCTPTPPPCDPNLVVEVVDPVNLPIPGAAVRVKARGRKEQQTLTTGANGLAQFCLVGDVALRRPCHRHGFQEGASAF